MHGGSRHAVHDLGVDVEPQKFVLKVKEVEPQIVAMSAVLTVAQRAMKNTVEAQPVCGQGKNYHRGQPHNGA